jgi:hypothetical protein
MTEIKISWKALELSGDREHASVKFELADVTNKDGAIDTDICNVLFSQTNHRLGKLWDIIKPNLSPKRTHTGLTYGDEIEIDGRVWVCSELGWKRLDVFEETEL